MEKRLFSYYSIDECLNIDKLYNELDKYADGGLLEYKLEDRDIIKIEDLDLTEDEIEDIEKLLDSLDVFPYLGYDDGEDEISDFDYGDEEEW